MWTGIGDFVEKLPKFLFKLSLLLILGGGGLEIAIRNNFIQPTSLHGYVAEGAPVVLVVGLAMLAVWLLLNIPTAFQKIDAYLKGRSEKRVRAFKLLDNLNFIGNEERLLLLWIIVGRNGRVPDMQRIKPFRELYRFNLILPEEFSWTIGGMPDGIYKVAPEVSTERVVAELRFALKKFHSGDLSSLDYVEQETHKLLEKHARGQF